MTSTSPFSSLKHHHEAYSAIDPSLPEHSNVSKTILVTAGATGVGFSIAQAYCISGAQRVILSSRNEVNLKASQEKLLKMFPAVQVDIVPFDLDQPSSIDSLWGNMQEKIDILILAAAHSPKRASSTQISVEDARAAMQTNIVGNWYMACQFVHHCRAHQRKGTIVDISSGAVHLKNGRNSVYGASKIGASFLLSSLADENKDRLRLFSIHPGTVWSLMGEKAGFKRADVPCDDDTLVGSFVIWLTADERTWLEQRFVWSNWDVEEMENRRNELLENSKLLTLGLIGWE